MSLTPVARIDRDWILLDSQSTVDLFSDKDLLMPGSVHETDRHAMRARLNAEERQSHGGPPACVPRLRVGSMARLMTPF